MTGDKKDASGKRGVLEGITVVEIGYGVAAPFLGMLLADQGATVVQIRRPGVDSARENPAYAIWNRGKHFAGLDLEEAAGRAEARALIERADILIEDGRPETSQRLGYGYEDVVSYNPSILYCAMPGYGPQSALRNEEGADPVVLAQTGVHQASVKDTRPQYNSLPFASMFSAIAGAGAIAAALLHRQRTGVGQKIEISRHSAMLILMGRYLAQPLERKMAEELFSPILPMRGRYRCADGRYVQNHGPYQHFVKIMLTVAGRSDLIADAVAAQKNGLTAEEVALWRKRFEDLFLQRTAREWEQAISDAGGACCMVRSMQEWLALPHAHDVGAVIEIDDPRFGRMKQPGLAVNLTGTPGGIAWPAPEPDEADGLADDRIASLVNLIDRRRSRDRQRSAEAPKPDLARPLAGMRVLDLCIVVAGPACGRALAELGADVIKIDSPHRDESRTIALDVNRGKRSILLDLKTDAGRAVFWRMVEEADVIVENYRPGKLAALGLGYEEVVKRKPDIVYASLNAYGFGGPFSGRPGWETIAQAMTGMQLRRGGRYEPATQVYPFNDYGTGLLTAYGILLALLERSRTGRGQWLWASLATTASLLQSRYMYDFEGARHLDVEGPAGRGESALSHMYETADEGIFLHAEGVCGWEALTGMPAFAGLRADNRFSSLESRRRYDWELSCALSAILKERERDHWLREFSAAGISAGACLTLAEAGGDETLVSSGLMVEREHPGLGRVRHTAPVVRFSKTPADIGRPSPVWGADGPDILVELGYREEQIAELYRSGVCRKDEVPVAAAGT